MVSPQAAGIEARGCDRYHCLLVRGEGGDDSVQGSLCIGRILHGLCLLEQRLLVLEQADKALQVQQRLASNVLAFVRYASQHRIHDADYGHGVGRNETQPLELLPQRQQRRQGFMRDFRLPFVDPSPDVGRIFGDLGEELVS